MSHIAGQYYYTFCLHLYGLIQLLICYDPQKRHRYELPLRVIMLWTRKGNDSFCLKIGVFDLLANHIMSCPNLEYDNLY